MQTKTFIFVVFSLCSAKGSRSALQSKERKLIWKLIGRSHAKFHQYDKRVRPINTTDESLPVRFSVNLIKFDPFPQDADVLSSHLHLRMKWRDKRLVWNRDEFNGQTRVNLPIDQLWRPDIALYNSVSGFDMTQLTKGEALVHDNGDVHFIPSVRLDSHCSKLINSQNRESTSQTCKMKWGSWTYTQSGIDPQLGDDTVDTADLIPNRCWRLDDAGVVRHRDVYACCPDAYVSIEYTFNFTNICT